MGEHQNALLGGEFAAYREAVLAAVAPAGPTAVRETVRRRRRRAAMAVAAAVVLAIAVPVAGWAALAPNQAARPTTGHSSEPTPSTTAPTGTPSPSVTPSAAPSVPTGRIGRDELLAVSVDLPAWSSGAGCRTRDVRLVERTGRVGAVVLSSGAFEYGDVDADGVAEPIGLLRCLTAEGPYPEQVVAFDRAPDGRVVVLGRVFRSDPNRPEWFLALDVRSDGSVRVEVSDQVPSDGSAPNTLHRQARTYQWNGSRFAQTAGPTAFPSESPPPDPTVQPSVSTPLFTVTTTTVTYGAPDADGWRRGRTTITFVNNGPTRLDDVRVSYTDNGRDTLEHTALVGCPTAMGSGGRILCFPEPVEPGRQGSVVFPFITKSSGPDHELTVVVDRGVDAGEARPGTATSATVAVTYGG